MVCLSISASSDSTRFRFFDCSSALIFSDSTRLFNLLRFRSASLWSELKSLNISLSSVCLALSFDNSSPIFSMLSLYALRPFSRSLISALRSSRFADLFLYAPPVIAPDAFTISPSGVTNLSPCDTFDSLIALSMSLTIATLPNR